MLKIIIIISVFFLDGFILYADQPDGSLRVYAEKDTADYSINVVFENMSGDTVVVMNRHRHIQGEWSSGTNGLWVLFFCNKRQVHIPWSCPPEYYCFEEIDPKKGNPHIKLIPPHGEIKLNIELPWFGPGADEGKYEYGIMVEIRYLYRSVREQNSKRGFTRTEYLQLDYRTSMPE